MMNKNSLLFTFESKLRISKETYKVGSNFRRNKITYNLQAKKP